MRKATNGSQNRNTRRTFLKSTGALATGFYLAGAGSAPARGETLAVDGGPKAVTVSAGGATSWPHFGDEERKAVDAVVSSPGYGEIDAFEKDWKEHFQPPYCKAHMNGTSALISGLFGLNLPAGSEILVPSLDPWFGILPMRFFDLVPVFVDSKPRTMNFDLDDAKKRLTAKTRGIEVVHLFGLPCEMEAICDFAKEKGLVILEDCAHAHNASINGKYVGNWGQIGAFSCQGSKVLPAIEGGMANYENREYYERAATFGHYECPGRFPDDSKYRKYGTGLGMKLRMHPMGAALARCQLRKIDAQTEMERSQHHELNARLCQLPGIYEQAPGPGVKRVYWAGNHLFLDPAKAGMSRETAIKALSAEGVSISKFGYSVSHRDVAFREAEFWRHMPVIPDRLPGLEEIERTGISLPRFTRPVPELVDQYVKAFEKVWAHRGQLGKA
ncbi:MAG: DegT/DnrJ/EryC1/StrS family aminotransferase [Pirellulales bacterium]|nr:DegT/DnrJ/EryC1/StrS family aminotransferase [Pirellulales bacterium]